MIHQSSQSGQSAHFESNQDIPHSPKLFQTVLQLYWFVIIHQQKCYQVSKEPALASHKEASSLSHQRDDIVKEAVIKHQFTKRCFPLTGCNQDKPLHEFDVTSCDALLLRETNFSRKCRSCSILDVLKSKCNRKHKRRLKELLIQVIKNNKGQLLSIVEDQSQTVDDIFPRIIEKCLEQWQQQNGKCSVCSWDLAKGNRVADMANDSKSMDSTWESLYVDDILDIEFRYLPQLHQIEWIHARCNAFHQAQSLFFAQYMMNVYRSCQHENKDVKDDKYDKNTKESDCFCQRLQLRFCDLVDRVCHLSAPFIIVLKEQLIWKSCWTLFRHECGDKLFQEIATRLLELSGAKKLG
jgi:hypothetical protein